MAAEVHPATNPAVSICHECDLPHEFALVGKVQKAKCSHCAAYLNSAFSDALEHHQGDGRELLYSQTSNYTARSIGGTVESVVSAMSQTVQPGGCG
jgi:hypothetical protein